MSTAIRTASMTDLPRIIELLAQLSLDESREDAGEAARGRYEQAMQEVLADERQTIMLAEVDGGVEGMACFVLIPNVSHVGRPYALVEDVVVEVSMRNRGVGTALMKAAISLARDHGCYKLVLTSNKQRRDAHRFYERLGFQASHEGFRLDL